jgi:hypothetical protein
VSEHLSRLKPHRWTRTSSACILVIGFCMSELVSAFPTSDKVTSGGGGAAWYPEFAWKYVNYTINWHASVKNWFTGPKTTVDPSVLDAEA